MLYCTLNSGIPDLVTKSPYYTNEFYWLNIGETSKLSSFNFVLCVSLWSIHYAYFIGAIKYLILIKSNIFLNIIILSQYVAHCMVVM